MIYALYIIFQIHFLLLKLLKLIIAIFLLIIKFMIIINKKILSIKLIIKNYSCINSKLFDKTLKDNI